MHHFFSKGGLADVPVCEPGGLELALSEFGRFWSTVDKQRTAAKLQGNTGRGCPRHSALSMLACRLVLFAVMSLLGLGECFLAPGSLTNSRRGRSSVRMIAEPLATEAASSEPKSPEALLIENEELKQKVLMLEETIERTEGLCEPLMGGGWAESLRSRASWLIGLLIAQSASSFILADNESLLATHPTVIFFLTMLVGAGGECGQPGVGAADPRVGNRRGQWIAGADPGDTRERGPRRPCARQHP